MRPGYNQAQCRADSIFGGRRELLARAVQWSGAPFLLRRLPARNSLLVLSYHRIGNSGGRSIRPRPLFGYRR